MRFRILCLQMVSVAVCIGFLTSCGTSGLHDTFSARRPQEAVITIDPSQKYQTIAAWEATAQAGQHFRSFPMYREELVSSAVNELGLNRLRLELRSGFENNVDYYPPFIAGSLPYKQFRPLSYQIINDNDDPFVMNAAGFQFSQLDETIEQVVLPMRKVLEARGEKLLVNLNYVDFGPSDFEHKEHPEEYAEFVLAAFVHMRDRYGFVPDSLEVILEPDTDDASWDPAQVARALAATAERLKSNGFDPGFIAPSTTNASNSLKYIDEIVTVPAALDAITEFSYHRYSGDSDDVLQDIGERGVRYGKRTSMLELIGADENTLHADLKLANVSAWQQYTLAFSGKDEGDAYYKVVSEESDPNLTMARITGLLRQYFRYVRPGAVRIGATTSNGRLDPVAFVNPDGGNVVVIKAATAGTAVISNLLPGRYSVTQMAQGQTKVGQELYFDHSGNEARAVSIGGPGVITVSSVGQK